MKLKETIELMTSENYHDRFKAEYYQLVIRYKRLVKIMQMWEDGTLEFEPNCPRGTYNLQMKFMADYIAVLESRAAIEGIELEDTKSIFLSKLSDLDNELIRTVFLLRFLFIKHEF